MTSHNFWACSDCGMHNVMTQTTCVLCSSVRKDDEKNTPHVGTAKRAWVCPQCTLHNQSDWLQCDVCGCERPIITELAPSSPGLSPTPEEILAFEAAPAPTSAPALDPPSLTPKQTEDDKRNNLFSANPFEDGQFEDPFSPDSSNIDPFGPFSSSVSPSSSQLSASSTCSSLPTPCSMPLFSPPQLDREPSRSEMISRREQDKLDRSLRVHGSLRKVFHTIRWCQAISEQSIKKTETQSKVESVATKLDHVIAEIRSTENIYLETLLVLEQGVLPKFKASDESQLELTQKQLQAIESNIPALVRLHKSLVADLQFSPELIDTDHHVSWTRSVASIDLDCKWVAIVFLEYVQFMKMYTIYINGYNRTLATVNSLRQNKKFQDLLLELRGVFPEHSLMSLLIQPIQRIPRYVLLLRQLYKYSCELARSTNPTLSIDEKLPDTGNFHWEITDNKDSVMSQFESFQLVGHALAHIEKLADFINENKRQAEDVSACLKIQNLIQGAEHLALATENRRLILDGILKKAQKGSWRVRHFFLFNDLLLWTNTVFEFKEAITVSDILCRKDHHTRTLRRVTQRFSSAMRKNLTAHALSGGARKLEDHKVYESDDELPDNILYRNKLLIDLRISQDCKQGKNADNSLSDQTFEKSRALVVLCEDQEQHKKWVEAIDQVLATSKESSRMI